ncbi:hypothetical protein QF035_009258 [Streptomyces umbrinus]|uniref:EF-hand domain-containing protein n=1 Tax=Streptomyces umbrinus TaxID=67370 RepID=A0ABU0T9N9_9ACTN|nr:EF-hand domain-containing protein [Streptomyces umbrinus]MDQ1031676.1 hypothetical protein [Streptomyces umbrinus]
MLGQVQKTNMDRVFDTLDVTRDGVVGADDFQITAQRMRSLRPNIDPQVLAEIEETFTAWWETIRDAADADGDGQITREEFVTASARGLEKDPAYVDKMVKVSEVTFRAADEEGDGQLTPLQVDAVDRTYGPMLICSSKGLLSVPTETSLLATAPSSATTRYREPVTGKSHETLSARSALYSRAVLRIRQPWGFTT